MTTQRTLPGPRAELDEGSVHDLYLDCAQLQLQLVAPLRPRHTPSPPIVVPDGARTLLAGLPAYGS